MTEVVSVRPIYKSGKQPQASPSLPIQSIVEIIARVADASPIPDTRDFFRDLVSRTDLRPPWKQALRSIWTGNVPIDARKLVDYALSKGTDSRDQRYTVLGNILHVLQRDDLGDEDAATLAWIMVNYKLIHDEKLLRDIKQRYEIASQDYGPDILWLGPDDERDIQSFFVKPPDDQSVGFFVRVVQCAASLCWLEIPNLQRTATGFLLADDLLLTNYHILKHGRYEDIDANARNLILRFGYSTDQGADIVANDVFKLADRDPIVDSSPTDFLNYVLLRVEGAVKNARNTRPLKEFDFNSPARGKVLNILQYQQGGTMQIGTITASVTTADEKRNLIQYVTPSLDGTSGSPCFDDKWRLVALHHAQHTQRFGSIREGILFGSIYERINRHIR